MVNSIPKHPGLNTRFPRVFEARLQLSLAENVFCHGMVVLLNPVCILLSEMLHVYIRAKYVLQFSRGGPPRHWLRSIRRLNIVELSG